MRFHFFRIYHCLPFVVIVYASVGLRTRAALISLEKGL